jgi:hypothetical protein
VFWLLRTASLGAYGVLALLGHYGVGTILACEGVTMVCVLALWGLALQRRDPRAPQMMIALGASAVAGCTRALPAAVTDAVHLDAISIYHLAQIPAMVLLVTAVRSFEKVLAEPPAGQQRAGDLTARPVQP